MTRLTRHFFEFSKLNQLNNENPQPRELLGLNMFDIGQARIGTDFLAHKIGGVGPLLEPHSRGFFSDFTKSHGICFAVSSMRRIRLISCNIIYSISHNIYTYMCSPKVDVSTALIAVVFFCE